MPWPLASVGRPSSDRASLTRSRAPREKDALNVGKGLACVDERACRPHVDFSCFPALMEWYRAFAVPSGSRMICGAENSEELGFDDRPLTKSTTPPSPDARMMRSWVPWFAFGKSSWPISSRMLVSDCVVCRFQLSWFEGSRAFRMGWTTSW